MDLVKVELMQQKNLQELDVPATGVLQVALQSTNHASESRSPAVPDVHSSFKGADILRDDVRVVSAGWTAFKVITKQWACEITVPGDGKPSKTVYRWKKCWHRSCTKLADKSPHRQAMHVPATEID